MTEDLHGVRISRAVVGKTSFCYDAHNYFFSGLSAFSLIRKNTVNSLHAFSDFTPKFYE